MRASRQDSRYRHHLAAENSAGKVVFSKRVLKVQWVSFNLISQPLLEIITVLLLLLEIHVVNVNLVISVRVTLLSLMKICLNATNVFNLSLK